MLSAHLSMREFGAGVNLTNSCLKITLQPLPSHCRHAMKPSIFLFPLALLAACGSKDAAQSAPSERPALTRVVGSSADSVQMIYSGEVRARHEVQQGFRIAGKLIERAVEAGTVVKAGQVLARLDPADAGLQTSAAQAQFRLAEAEVRRYRELQRKGFVSQSALDGKEAAWQAASAQIGLARNQSDYTVLHAERDGVVTATLAEPGQVLAGGQAVLRLAETGEREVAIEIPEAQFGQRKLGEAAEITLFGGLTLSGRLRELSPAADPASRTYAARVSFAARPEQAALGMTASVRFSPSNAAREPLLIPLSAIYQQGKQTAVWVVAADRSVSLRQVAVAAYRDDGAVIAGGLNAGERIVSAGVHRLVSGEKIHIIQSNSDSGRAP